MRSLTNIAILALLILPSLAYSQTLINSSFEDYNEGSVFGQDNWIEDNDNNGLAEIITSSTYAHDGTKGLKVFSLTAVETVVDHISFNKDESGIAGNMFFDMWVKVVSAPTNNESVFIRVLDYLPSNQIRRAAEIRLLPDGGIGVNGSSSSDASTTIGEWVRISMSVDYTTEKYEVAINGSVLTEVFDFRESYNPADMNRPSGIKEYHGLRFWYEDAIGDVAVDELYVGTDPIDGIAFTPPSSDRTITVTQPDKAIITLSPDQAIYQSGDVVTATLLGVETHYKFNGWTGSYSGTENPLTINVTGNVTLGADIIIDPLDPPNEYTITLTQPEGGTITVNPESGPYYEGSTVVFTVTAAIGYNFGSWIGINGDTPQVGVMLSENLDVSANMVLKSITKRTVHVSTRAELEEAVDKMQPGDSIVLADGTYDQFNESMLNQGGTADYPVYIIAANQGMAKITGSSNFRMDNCAYINIMGLDIDIDDKNNIFKLTDCNNVRISRNTITSSKSDGSSKWIEIGGVWDAEQTFSHHNRIDHNLFENKMDGGALLIIGGNSGENEPSISQHDRIDHNHFKNIGPRVTNEKETIRVGYSKLSVASAYTIIENNLFEACDGDPEIISVKSCDNYVRNNTFVRSLGTVSLRHGNRTEVSGNFFIGDGKTAQFEGSTIGCGGVRVYGKDHKIFNNYFEGLTGFRWDAACTLTGGDAINDDFAQGSNLTKHYQIENLEFTHNTLVNNFSDIEIGYRDDWSKDPKNVLIANNVIIQDENPVTKVYDNRDGGVSFADNIIYTIGTGSWGDRSFTAAEATNVDPLLALSNCKIPAVDCEEAYPNAIYKISSTSSPAVDPTPASTITEAIGDIEGQLAVGARDLGADEYNGTEDILNGLLDERHVGPDAVPLNDSEARPIEYTITLEQTTGGTISISPTSGPYTEGMTVTFTAIPDEQYVFSTWNGITGTETEQLVVINSNLTVSASFTPESVLGIESAAVLSAYPNPIENELTLISDEPISHVALVSMAGRNVAVTTQKNQNGLTIRLAEVIQRGTYILRVHLEQGEELVYKIVKR